MMATILEPTQAGPVETRPQYSIVVATRDRGTKIVSLMESIVASEESDFELVIVDQSTSQDTERALAPFLVDPRIRYVHSDTRGLSRARNLGIALTSAPIIVITDDDCVVPPTWLAGMGRPFKEYPRVGLVFCSVEPLPVEAPGHTPHIIFSANRLIQKNLDVWRTSDRGLSLGAGMALRREFFVELGGFDELLGAGAKYGSTEDNDLSWRGLLRGWWTFQSADVTVIHDGFRTLDEVRALVSRDAYGIGGAVAKYLRAGKVSILWFLSAWLLRHGVIRPATDLVSGRRPRGFRTALMTGKGVLDGLREPFDRAAVMYRRQAIVGPG